MPSPPVDHVRNHAIWRQFSAAIAMLENAVVACPAHLWAGGDTPRAFWYLTYHTLFFLDLYTFGTIEGFAPPAPFTLSECNPRGVYPDRAYTQAELLGYLSACRERARASVLELSAEGEQRRCTFSWGSLTYLELVLDNMRHVQHHAAQLNWMLRDAGEAAPRWVSGARAATRSE